MERSQSDLKWQEKLLSWDGNSLVSSQEATLFNEWTSCLYNVTFFELGFAWEDTYRTALVFNSAQITGEGDDASCSYWNQTCVAYSSSCFSSAISKFPVRVPPWGNVPHDAFFPHIAPVPFQGKPDRSQRPLLTTFLQDNLFVSVGGSGYTPNAAHASGIRGPVLAGPSLRFIADMSGQVPNQMVLPGGESGDPTSPHYRDQLPFWADIQTLDMDWSQFASEN